MRRLENIATVFPFMRKEVQNWLDQAADDFDGAEFNFRGKKYYIAAFLCQQAVEKALKALLIEKSRLSEDSRFNEACQAG